MKVVYLLAEYMRCLADQRPVNAQKAHHPALRSSKDALIFNYEDIVVFRAHALWKKKSQLSLLNGSVILVSQTSSNRQDVYQKVVTVFTKSLRALV